MLFRLLLFLLYSIVVYSEPLQLSTLNSTPLNSHIYYLEDSQGKLNWNEVKKENLTLYSKNYINFGFTKSVYWFKVDLQRNINEDTQWWLNIAYPLLDYIEIYTLDSNQTLIDFKRTGAMETDRFFPMRNFISQLEWDKKDKISILIRIKTQSSMQVPMSLITTDEVFSQLELGDLRIGIYYGIFLIIFLYNSIIYFYTKDSNYLRYILFLFAFISWQLSFDGIGREYIWNQNQWYVHKISAAFIAFSALTALYFSRNFLMTKLYVPKFDMAIFLMIIVSGILTCLSIALPYSSVIMYNTALATIVPVVLLIAGISVMRKGYRPARFYVAGWSLFLIATTLFAFNKFDLIPSFYGVNHVQQIGSAVEMIFLSWALADRVHLLQNEYIDKLNHLNETLSENVDHALNEARMKDRLFVQQSRLAAMGEMIEQIAHQWRQPLNTLALINQDLYVKYKLGKCDESCFDQSHEQVDHHLQYLSKTIDDFRNYYKTDKSKQFEDIGDMISVALRLSEVFLRYAKIQTIVKINTLQKVHLARNEMIQVILNLLKNAHDAIVENNIQKGKIFIYADEIINGIRVSVEDNAGGISPEIMDHIFDIYFTTKDPEHGTGLGLHMSKFIIEESFGGKISVENGTKGARFIIDLPIRIEEDSLEIQS